MTKKDNRPKTEAVKGYTYLKDGKVIRVGNYTRRKAIIMKK